MKKVQLERILQSLEPVPAPRADLEQYATPATIAAEVAFIALAKGDIAGRGVLDLGCGNGILGIAAMLLGAASAVGVDADPKAIAVAERNSKRAKVEVLWQHGDVKEVSGAFDTVLMNPPFGSQTRHADLPFLDRALSLASVVYSFHNGVTAEFIEKRIAAAGASITDRVIYDFPLPRTFAFQRADVRRVSALLLRIESARG